MNPEVRYDIRIGILKAFFFTVIHMLEHVKLSKFPCVYAGSVFHASANLILLDDPDLSKDDLVTRSEKYENILVTHMDQYLNKHQHIDFDKIERELDEVV